jgi:hypothetical protein
MVHMGVDFHKRMSLIAVLTASGREALSAEGFTVSSGRQRPTHRRVQRQGHHHRARAVLLLL